MTALQVPVRPAPAGKAAPLSAQQRRAHSIGSFDAAVQKAIRRLTEGEPALEDLAETFPALLYALVTGYGTAACRAQTIALVKQGAPLRHAANTLGLPWWLRRVPASALDGSLRGLPSDTDESRALASLIPADPVAMRSWLKSVSYACRAAGPSFGLWLGYVMSRTRGALVAHGSDNLRLLAAWAWASQRPQTRLGQLVRRPWTPASGVKRALDELTVWRQRIFLELLLASRLQDLELSVGSADELTFVPLKTAGEFIAEAIAMDNCLDQYGERLAERRSHVVSVRRNGRPVADLEIGRHEEEPAIAAIRQLRGQRNRRAGTDIWRAAYAWLATQPLEAVTRDSTVDAQARRAAAATLWDSYLADRAGHLTTAEVRALKSMAGTHRAATRSAGQRLPTPHRAARMPRRAARCGDAPLQRAVGAEQN